MIVNINLKVTSFGQIIFEIGKASPLSQEPPTEPAHEEIRYHEPLETASRIYEIQYGQKLRDYIVPCSTA